MSGSTEKVNQFVWMHKHAVNNSEELRMSIWSVLRFVDENAHITIVGDRPKWYRGHHIPPFGKPVIDRISRMPYRNTQAKMLHICASTEIDERFVWMMDDQIFMQPTSVSQIAVPRYDPWYKKNRNNEWNKILYETFTVLSSLGKPNIQYATHLPHVFEKSKMLESLRLSGAPKRLTTFENMYGNFWYSDPEPYTGFLLRLKDEAQASEIKTSNCHVLNYYETAWGEKIRSAIRDLIVKTS